MISKSNLFMAAFMQIALLESTSAADRKSGECGLASVYSTDSEGTASGEDTQPKNLTAAHRSLPFGTLVHVDDRENGRSAVVRITDRGPFTSGRIIDLSKAAARELRISSLSRVCLNILSSSRTFGLAECARRLGRKVSRDSDQSREQLGSKAMRYDAEMAWRPGEVLYWTSTVIAGLIVLLVVANYMSNTGMGEPIIRIIPLLLAAAIWLVGWVGRRVFAGR